MQVAEDALAARASKLFDFAVLGLREQSEDASDVTHGHAVGGLLRSQPDLGRLLGGDMPILHSLVDEVEIGDPCPVSVLVSRRVDDPPRLAVVTHALRGATFPGPEQ